MRSLSERLRTKLLVPATVWAAGACLRLHAMERWVALSQIESGDNDRALGLAGEVSRYQIKPDVWRRYASTNFDWEKPGEALAVAKAVMQARCAEFERANHRAPTDFEFYVLWNAPARVQRPGKIISQRAQRFCNLVADH
jgi:hypothetical protein